MSTQTAVEQKCKQVPPGKSGTEEPPAGAVQRLKAERVQEELKAMAGWAAIDRDTAVEAVKTFATPGIAGHYAAFAIQSAAASGFPVTVSVNGNQVGVTVYTPDIDGCPSELTLPVLAFARQL